MKKLVILGGIIAIFLLGLFIWWQSGMGAPDPRNTEEALFVVTKGAGPREVGNDLKEQGFIKDPVVFFLYVKKEGLDTEIQAGSHYLSPAMTLPEVLAALQHGTVDIWVTIPEGYRSEQIAETLAENVENYDESWSSTLKEHEGFLFPDTYLISRDAHIEAVIEVMRGNFNTKLQKAGINPNDPDILDIVTMASLIEREAITDEEKPMIASVIANRLNDGMGLDIDATLQYITGTSGAWWEVPTGEERAIDSPYNTYRYPGLPPGPIANPGIEAIKAAVNPASSPYYYYIHAPSGESHFAETLTEHNVNIEKYLN